MLKTVPSGTLQEDFFSEEGRSFFLMSSSILHGGELENSFLLATPIPGAALVLLLRHALSEWAKGAEGYATQLYSPDPVTRLHQERVNAPGHADWGHVTCQSCEDTFALGYKGNVIRRAEMLKELGVKPLKTLPAELVEATLQAPALSTTSEDESETVQGRV
jgi:hypothetical protein